MSRMENGLSVDSGGAGLLEQDLRARDFPLDLRLATLHGTGVELAVGRHLGRAPRSGRFSAGSRCWIVESNSASGLF